MKRHFSLAGLNWELVGTKPYYWKLDRQMERMKITQPEEKPVPAPVPGSVQQALFNAGILPDWNIGTNYRQCVLAWQVISREQTTSGASSPLP